MSIYKISKEKELALKQKMELLDIKESDIQQRFIRSGGAGGQKTNKTSTCVYLKHIPTGTEVKCQKERYQSLNRFFARRMLIEKIEKIILKEQSEKLKKLAKLRKQKKRRSKKAKEKILKLKKIRSEKKQMRAYKPDIIE